MNAPKSYTQGLDAGHSHYEQWTKAVHNNQNLSTPANPYEEDTEDYWHWDEGYESGWRDAEAMHGMLESDMLNGKLTTPRKESTQVVE